MTTKLEKESEAKAEKIKALVPKWRAAKDRFSDAEKELKDLREQLVALGIEAGHEDELLQVVGTEEIDPKNKKLLFVLWKQGVWFDAHEYTFSEKRVKELAKANFAIARALKQATTPGLRFNAKKKT